MPTTEPMLPHEKSVSLLCKHDGFIMATGIVITLLLMFAMLAFITWSRDTAIDNNNDNLPTNNRILETRNMNSMAVQTQSANDVFYYFDSNKLHAISQAEDIIVWEGDSNGVLYSVYAQPRIGFDGRIFVRTSKLGDEPTLNLSVYDSKTGTMSQLNDKIIFPYARATKLARNERYVAAIYDNPKNGHKSRELKIIDLLDETSVQIGVLDETERFVISDIGQGGSHGQDLEWVSNNCVKAQIYESGAGSENTPTERRQFCM
jgi:hypothetical protein